MALELEKLSYKGILVCLFFLLAGGGILITGDVDSSIIAKLLWAGIYGIAGIVAFVASRPLLLSIQRTPGFMFISILCVLSIFWTSSTSSTLAHGVAIFGATLVAYLMATKVPAIQLLQLAAVALFCLLLINTVLMIPNLGGNLSSGIRYRGIFTQPNVLGRIAGLSLVLFAGLTLSGYMRYSTGFIGAGMGALMIFSCNSMTSVLAVFVSIGIFMIYRMIGRPVGTGYIAVSAWFGLCLGGLIWLNQNAIIEFVFGLMGRSTSLTGRTGLWDGIWDAILRQPVLGYGYSGFWSGEPLLSARILEAAGWTTKSAHNGILDIALHLGGVGVFIFVMTMWKTLTRGLKLAFGDRNVAALILVTLVIYVLILGSSESVYMIRNSMYWVIFCLSSVYFYQFQYIDSEDTESEGAV